MQTSSHALVSQSADTAGTGSHSLTFTYICARLPAAVVTLLVMLLLKLHYSLATPAQLDWILGPTAALLSWLTPANPVMESGIGYVDFGKGIVIAPACAGINFMIMAFGLTAFCGLHQIRRLTNQLAWLILALPAAYGLTLVVNTVRIALSMALYQADFCTSWLTIAQVHRLAGVALYLGALWLYFVGLQQILATYFTRSDHLGRRRGLVLRFWPALAWYLAGTVGVPLTKRFWQQGLPAFSEHIVTVTLASLALCAVVLGVNRMLKAAYRRVSHSLQPSG